jgi:predicted choloylglycine hydrolase
MKHCMRILFVFILVACSLAACDHNNDTEDSDDAAQGEDDDRQPVSILKHERNPLEWCGLVATIDKGRRYDCHGVTVVYTEGTPRELGYQTGYLMRPEITELIHFVRNYFDPIGLVWGLFQAMPSIIEPQIRPEFLDEIHGMTEGLNNDVTYDELLTGNCLGDIFGAARAFLDNYTNVDWCSLTASWGDATADGEMIVTRNFDYMNVFSSNNFIAVVKPDKGHAFVTTGIAGLIGIHAGMNEIGITGSLAYNSSYDSDMSGVPMLLLLREAVQFGDSVDEAEQTIIAADRTMGLNYMFTDSFENKARILEVSGGKWAFREAAEADFLVATNHYVAPEMLDQQRGYDETQTSMVRYDRLNKLLNEKYGKVDLETAGLIMRDHFDSVLGVESPDRVTICRHDDIEYEEGSLMNLFVSTTTPSILMKPIEGRYCTTVTRHACEMPYFCFAPFED